MARKTVFVSDFSGKELPEDEAVSVRIQDSGGEWHNLDGTEDEVAKVFDKLLSDDTNISRQVNQETEDKINRAIRAKIEAGELIDAQSVRGQTTRKTRVETSSGKSKEELATIRAWAKENGYEISDRGRVAQTIIDQYEDAKGAKQDA